ncbi:glycoside hydrolase family 32 protein [uncultured Dokdonia sp.]|uniref:glycoside hydrolase family 32 protein n=1 Tax=uncultured Dokdonia sp. TaxID=575653 RepID=UPI00260839B8|nr:glycoside hydrolase family 32 protein [uncultured Dokdonia sp.]
MRILPFLFLFLVLTGCKKEATSDVKEESTEKKDVVRFRESYRPQYHFTPPEKWMNDPNGLLFYKDTYHLFYQYYPEDIVWGPMHWGHATSKDLVSWEHQPIALYPDELGYIFSGSAVMDLDNTSGLGTKDNPPMVAIFTHHEPKGEKEGRNDFQYQSIAYSLDEGTTWTKYEGNPVIGNPTSIRDFRDPKVMWHKASQKWILTLVAGDHAKFYSSPDLKSWTYLSDFGKEKGAHGGVWECPDLFPLTVAGSDETKWVLLISMNPGAPNGGSGTQYFIGDFDGTSFTTTQKDIKWLDYGSDNYAGVTYNGLPDNDRTFIGWMSNWNYAQKTPTKNWRSAMTLSRKLTLHKNDAYYLKSYPVPAIEEYTYSSHTYDSITNNYSLTSENFNEMRIDFEIEGDLKDFEVKFSNIANDQLFLGYHKADHSFYVDRRKSGKTNFEPKFAEKVHVAPALNDGNGNTVFSIFMDASSLEFLVDQGATVMTEQLFPTQPYTAMTFTSKDHKMTQVRVSKMKRIWE